MSTFDGIKALREEIAGLNEIIATLTHRRRDAERKLSEAEVDAQQIIKLHGFAVGEVTRKRAVLKALEEGA